MPYTPPAVGSPAASSHNSPPRSPGPQRPNLPRSNSSTSYLSRHRRSPSWQPHSSDKPGPLSIPHDATHHSIRQSPPPVTDSPMPAGAIISPPDSTQNSSDDDEPSRNNYPQEQDLQELQEAVRTISINRAPTSPPNGQQQQSKYRGMMGLDMHRSNSDSDLSSGEQPPAPPRLSASARKISHSRSATEGSILDTRTTKSAGASPAASDESDEDLENGEAKPPLLRKKSGELVKPAIRPSSRRKHSSMPGTPTYSKAVHFNDDIEQVRHFLQVDRPIAVSAGTSPVDGYDEETEFPFGFQGNSQYEWDIRLANFPRESFERLALPIRVERIFLSADQKHLIGVVAVANLAFHKTVVARFTLDYWKTTSEVLAEFNNDVRQKPRVDGYDQFNFTIKLSDLNNLESKTLFICMRYQVNGQEYWDNNNSMNYQVDFVKKEKNQEPKSAQPVLGARPIPRSRHSSSSPRPRSIPSYDDDFGTSFDANSAIKFRSGQSSKADLTDAPLQKRQAPSGHQFGSRYDFGASLSAALVQAQAQLSTSNTQTKRHPQTETPKRNSESLKLSGIPAVRAEELSRTGYVPPVNSAIDSPRPEALLANKQTLDSRAYQDFVSKFCFFGTSKAGANKPQQHQGGTDGAQDDASPSPDSQTGYFDHVADSNESQPPQPHSTKTSGTSSPLPAAGMGSGPRAESPVSFGYPYTVESRTGGFNPEAHTATAIQG